MQQDNPVAKSDEADAFGPTPSQELAQWANEQDSWVRLVVELVLASRRELTDSEHDVVFEHLLREKGLDPNPVEERAPLPFADELKETQPTLTLSCLSDLKNVNALAPGQEIGFGESLTVLFGQNASGKTGYSRVIKRMANVRTVEEILGNAHLGMESSPISAVIEFAIDGEEQKLFWTGDLGVDPLNRVSVFDSPSVALHVNRDLDYTFTPSELNLLKIVNNSIKRSQERLKLEAESLAPTGNPLLSSFTKGSAVYSRVETLNAGTDLSELGEIAGLSSDESDELDKLQQDVAALKAGAHDSLIAQTRALRTAAMSTRGVLQVCGNFDKVAYSSAISELTGARSVARAAREALATDESLPELDEKWQAFIAAADEYQKHVGHDKYPDADQPCPYCRQPLDEQAQERLAKFRNLLEGALQKDVSAKLAAVESIGRDLVGADIQSRVEAHAALTSDGVQATWLEACTTALVDWQGVRSSVVERTLLNAYDPPDLSDLLNALEQEIETLGERSSKLSAEKSAGDGALQDKTRRIRDLTDRKRLGELWTQIEDRTGAAKRSANFQTLAERISNGALRSSTELSKTVSTKTVNNRFGELFREECKALRAPDVDLEFIGRSGRAERRKEVASHKPAVILSEGEQKVLAIADFLAECRMRGARAPIIFDDPVSSLDYRRLKEVAQRITELSRSHQVVVFTHNIMFATSLLDMRSGKKERCRFYEISDDGTSKGIVGADIEPQLDSPKEVAKEVEAALKRAGEVEDDPILRDALVKQAAGLIRKWLETFVEQDLLGKVTQRFRADVKLGSLGNIKTDRLDAAIAVISKTYGVTSGVIEGHSHADEQKNVRMTRSELQEIWEAAKQARTEYLAS